MNRIKYLAIIVILALCMSGCKNDKPSGLQTKIFPQDNVLTFVTPVTDTVELNFELFSTDEDNGYVKENIEDIYISDEGKNVPASIVRTVQHAKVSVDEYSIYRTSFTVLISKKDSSNINNAVVNIKLKDEDDYTSYTLGNLSFIDNEDDGTIRRALEVTDISPITKEINGIKYTVGLILRLDAADNITIKEFDMGLNDYGVSDLYIVNEKYDKIVAQEKNQCLDKCIKGIYETDTVQSPSCTIEPVTLDKGIYTALIKFDIADSARTIASLGGNIFYQYKDKSYVSCVNCYRILVENTYSGESLRKILYKDIFSE